MIRTTGGRLGCIRQQRAGQVRARRGMRQHVVRTDILLRDIFMRRHECYMDMNTATANIITVLAGVLAPFGVWVVVEGCAIRSRSVSERLSVTVPTLRRRLRCTRCGRF